MTSDKNLEKAIDTRPLTLPVHITVDVEGLVLNQPELESLLRAASLIAVGGCGCRTEKGLCDGPLDVCLGLNEEAQENIDRDGWREIDVAEAMGILEMTHRAGLVHLAYRRSNGYVHLVCSCCTCCCGFLTSLSQLSYKDALTTSSYVAEHSVDACRQCGICVERCPFGAFTRSADGNSVAFHFDQCFGCGLCVSTCPSEAIRFVER